jgi:hypothetical protein
MWEYYCLAFLTFTEITWGDDLNACFITNHPNGTEPFFKTNSYWGGDEITRIFLGSYLEPLESSPQIPTLFL